MTDNERKMGVVGHLTELRMRLIWTILVFVVSMVIGFFLAKPVIEWMKNDPAAENIPWFVFALPDALRVYMQFAFVIGLIITIPFALYQMWKFVSPGLREHERKAALWFIPSAVVLFLFGISFGYLVLFPLIVGFMSNLADSLGAQEAYGLAQYFRFMFNMVLPIGLLFEMPVIVMFLTRLRLINPMRLNKFRRYAYLILVIIATTITPPELISEILVAIPLLLLYEFSILISRVVYRKQLREDAEWEAEFGKIQADEEENTEESEEKKKVE
ncbi:MAG: twin-arginine translocase subunit TatC [Bacillaceae bacterium]|nr:twin-arginine translocase subunit TatC [Bacillaceae bacterium]